MARTFVAILFVFVGSAVVSAADEKQERNFRMSDAFNDPHYSSVTAAKTGFKVFTNPPGQGLIESLTLTHSDGLYVAGEKVVTESEHRRVVGELETRHQGVVSELRDELQVTRNELRSALDILNLTITNSLQDTQSEVLALVQALREVTPANGSAIVQPPTCEEPGGDKLHFNGTHWDCVCNFGWSGKACEYGPTNVPTGAPVTSMPTLAPSITRWVKLLDNAYYTGLGQNRSAGFTPLAYGTFTRVRAVYRSGYIVCAAGFVPRNLYHWQECAPFVCNTPYTSDLPSGRGCHWNSYECSSPFAFELEKNNIVLLQQPEWCELPSSCTAPSTITGDIICDVQLALEEGDVLRPTWFEERTRWAISDNGGVIFIDLYGA